MTNNMNNMQSI